MFVCVCVSVVCVFTCAFVFVRPPSLLLVVVRATSVVLTCLCDGRVRGCFIVISIRELFLLFVGHDAWFGLSFVSVVFHCLSEIVSCCLLWNMFFVEAKRSM